MHTFPLGLIRLLYHSTMSAWYVARADEEKRAKHDTKIEELKKQ